jgi:LPXTG-motif cell wall-anchored protein
MMVKRKINVLMIAVFLFSLIAGGFQAPVFAAVGEKNASVTVIGDDPNTPMLSGKQVTYGDNATALDVLIAAVGKDGVNLDETKMINGILGLDNKDPNYWMYYVNGISATVGADSYVVHNGDKITFRYEDYMTQPEGVSIDVIGNDGTTIKSSNWPYAIFGEPTAFQLLQALVGPENVGFHEDPNYGIMIDSISGVTAEGYSYWSFLVNGGWASVGAGSYVLKPGDKITFKYETYVPPTDTPADGGATPTDGNNPTSNDPIPSATIQNAIDSAITQIPADQVGEWEAVALKQAGKTIPADYLAKVTKEIIDANGTFRKITDYERDTLGILAAGGDPINVGGYNLISSIYNGDVTKQGMNGVAYALIALDSANFEIPDNAKWTREKLVQYLLDNQQQDGRWTGLGSDVDLTAMVLTALAPYQDQEKISETVKNAVNYLSAQYLEGKIDNSQAAAQVIIALSALKIDANGVLFTKDGSSIISYLLSFQNADNGFAWKKGDKSELSATSQAVQALVAYQLFVNGKGSLFSLPLAPISSVADQPNTVSSTTAVSADTEKGKLLPNTATNSYNLLAMGLLIIMLGLSAFVLGKRKKA